MAVLFVTSQTKRNQKYDMSPHNTKSRHGSMGWGAVCCTRVENGSMPAVHC